MRAVVLSGQGGPEMLRVVDRPTPPVVDGHLQVRVKAAALNHLDIWVREGLPGGSEPLVPGSDGACVVTAVGAGAGSFAVGDEIVVQPGIWCGVCQACQSGRENYCPQFAILGEDADGLLQEVVNLLPANAYKKPSGLTWAEAASFGLVFLTAYEMLIVRAGLREGETVLVLAGSSGVGAAAIQIAVDRGARVIATASSPEKAAFAKAMGADETVDHYGPDWHKEALEMAGASKFQVVVEHVGAATWQQSLRVLGLGGRIVFCGATTGPEVAIELRHLFRKQQSVLGSTMGSASSFAQVVEKFEQRRYRPIVDKVFPLTEIAAAHRYLEQGPRAGKVVLSLE